MGKILFSELTKQPLPLKRKRIHVEEWGGEFYINQLTGRELMDALPQLFEELPEGQTRKNNAETTFILMSMAITDEDGNRAPQEWMENLPLHLIKKLGQEVMDWLGLSEELQIKTEKNF